MRLMDDWFGPSPHGTPAVIAAPWNSEWVGASYPGAVVTTRRWLRLPRDARAERILIAALARQYWMRDNGDRAFREGMVLFSATRAMHEVLKGRNYATAPAFGGFFAYPMRAIQLSPIFAQAGPRVRDVDEIHHPLAAPWRFAGIEPGSAARRAADALFTLERYVGWPALQQALAELARGPRAVTPAALAEILREQRSVDMTWFFDATLAADRNFDYAVEALTSGRSSDDPATYRSVVSIRRHGSSMFAGTSRPRDQEAAASLQVSVRLEDGSSVTGSLDGRDIDTEIAFESRSPAVAATVDPMRILLLDDNRLNNSRRLQRMLNPTGVRLTLHWLIWLQDVMLSSVSLL